MAKFSGNMYKEGKDWKFPINPISVSLVGFWLPRKMWIEKGSSKEIFSTHSKSMRFQNRSWHVCVWIESIQEKVKNPQKYFVERHTCHNLLYRHFLVSITSHAHQLLPSRGLDKSGGNFLLTYFLVIFMITITDGILKVFSKFTFNLFCVFFSMSKNLHMKSE